ncbi:DUF1127 domain-containing protein [Mesorhizobium sp. B1-1-8]|uniref:DUF1127 domain-containing protein n=1 Tax=Mesorhizobium sp. B1-1-8 TaxID=2589976 RepID=UPI0011260512|nr:DUF1127 domain-containing protein [Mesorhizobium sp. B1-1-8]UCI08369.1 DUF1127 domain-containing protein [Mesorhizobium sp. B1-1-8]
MSEIALKCHTTSKSPLPLWLRAAFDWLRQARIATTLAHESLDDLSDRQLRDIGVERHDIAKAMDRELGRIGLLGSGWQQPRR